MSADAAELLAAVEAMLQRDDGEPAPVAGWVFYCAQCKRTMPMSEDAVLRHAIRQECRGYH